MMTTAETRAVVKKAKRGDNIIYATLRGLPRQKPVGETPAGRAAWDMYARGVVALVQKRTMRPDPVTDIGDLEYIMQKL